MAIPNSFLGLLSLLLPLLLLSISKELEASTVSEDELSLYIVYLGGRGDRDSEELVQSHHDMLAAVPINSEQSIPRIVYSYKHGFNGFAATMSKEQAAALANMPEVVTVFQSKTLELHTTRSWDFLQLAEEKLSNPMRASSSNSADVIIGMLDTGVWPESESFNDEGLSSPPSRWKGVCNNTGAKSSEVITCNNKIIGTRAYSSSQFVSKKKMMPNYVNARDDEGHGSHTASTAGGSVVGNASMAGVASGKARGGLPTARLAIYKVCGSFGCFEADILKAFDDAMHDGVDILSLSLGGGPAEYDQDGIAIGAFHAIENGITVSCSAGNSGPDASSVANGAPWIVTVGASTIDRCIAADIMLGNNETLQGTALSFHSLSKNLYGLVLASQIPANKTTQASDASACVPDSLDVSKIKNRIVVCAFDPESTSRRQTTTWLKENGAVGAVLINDFYADIASYVAFPATIVKTSVGNKLMSYINSTASPVGTLLATTAQKTTPAPVIAGFSSRGPNSISPDIIKPDITAPGVNILAAWSASAPAYYEDYDTSKPVYVKYNIISGTSMSCPHVTGALAYVKSVHPAWSPAALRSALMTTATSMDDIEEAITDYDGHKSNPFAYGSGQINPSKAVSPGLIYDISTSDYVDYLCATGYDASKISIITGKNSTCPKQSGSPNLNYPSISFPTLSGSQTATRYLTSVDASATTYEVVVSSPSTLSIKVSPTTLSFSGTGNKQSYTVTVTASGGSKKSWQFASLTWKQTDGSATVYSPIAVKLK